MKKSYLGKRVRFRQNLCYRISRQYILLFLATIFVMSLFLVRITAKLTKEESLNMSELLMERLQNEFTSRLEHVETTINTIYFHDQICDIVASRDETLSDYEKIVEAKKVKEVLANIQYVQKDIDSIWLYSLRNSRKYENTNKFGYRFDTDVKKTLSKEKIENIIDAKGRICIEPAVQEEQTGADGTMFTVYKAMLGDNAVTPIGIIKINFEMQILPTMEKQIQNYNGGEFFILDENQEVIYSTLKTSLDFMKMQDNWMIQNDVVEDSVHNMDGESYFINRYEEEVLQWKFFFMIPQKAVEKNGKILSLYILVTGILAIILSGVFIFRTAKKFTIPIIGITEHLKKIEKGDFIHVPVDYEYEDEIQNLICGVNHMADRIDELINREYEAKLLLKDAQFNRLVAQINPHFLYNVMENISGIGYSRNIPELSLITENLVDMLKYCIDDKMTAVFLETEMKYVRKYLEIQNYRFNGGIKLQTDIPQKLMKETVLKFMIQPIVENAIIHGLSEKFYQGNIWIKAWEENNCIYISVEDDGIGMKPEVLEKLNKNELVKETGADIKTHIGIWNVVNRIKLYFGEEYGILYESITGMGTKVTVFIPKQTR